MYSNYNRLTSEQASEVNKRKCGVLIPRVVMNLAHIWQLCLFRAADNVDELFYRNLFG